MSNQSNDLPFLKKLRFEISVERDPSLSGRNPHKSENHLTYKIYIKMKNIDSSYVCILTSTQQTKLVGQVK